jgi:hypothetical protein
MVPALRPRRGGDPQPNNEVVNRDEPEEEEVPRMRLVRVNLGQARVRGEEQEGLPARAEEGTKMWFQRIPGERAVEFDGSE